VQQSPRDQVVLARRIPKIESLVVAKNSSENSRIATGVPHYQRNLPMRNRTKYLLLATALLGASSTVAHDLKATKKGAKLPTVSPADDDAATGSDDVIQDDNFVNSITTSDFAKRSKKNKQGKKGRSSNKATRCSFKPFGNIQATADEVVTGPAASRGTGDFSFQFADGFGKMKYEITIIDQSSPNSVELFCASEGNEADSPAVSLDFRSNERTFSSVITASDINKVVCEEDGTVINNIGKWILNGSIS
jgi:hypothetical protein